MSGTRDIPEMRMAPYRYMHQITIGEPLPYGPTDGLYPRANYTITVEWVNGAQSTFTLPLGFYPIRIRAEARTSGASLN